MEKRALPGPGKPGWLNASLLYKVFGGVLFAYLFLGFMVVPCLNTLLSVFREKNPVTGEVEPFRVINYFFSGTMPSFILNSVILAVALVITVNVVGISIVLLTEYFDIKGAKILRLGYMTTLIYSGMALVTGYLFLYGRDGIVTQWLQGLFPQMDKKWFGGFYAVLFTMTFACTSNHALFLRNAIRSIDYNTVEAARNLGAHPFRVLMKVVMPTLLPTLFSLTVMTFITGLCAMSAPKLLGYNSINPQIVELAGKTRGDIDFPQAQAALMSIILALFTVILLTTLNHYERKGHYLSVSKTKAKLVKQKIQNPVGNVLAHIYAYLLFVIYMLPVVMIVLFSFQNYGAVNTKKPSVEAITTINYFGSEDVEIPREGKKPKIKENVVTGVFTNPKTGEGIRLSFLLAASAAALACVIVVAAVNYIFKQKNKKRAVIVEACLLFPWLLPTILICYSYRIFFNSENIWYVFNQNLYTGENVRLLLIIAYTVVKLPFALRMIKAAFYAIDEELEDAARNLGASGFRTLLKIKLPIILPSVLAVFALNFNSLFTEYDMGATFFNPSAVTYARVIESMSTPELQNDYNAAGRQCASTVFIMIVSGLILYLVYGVGSRDLGERLERRAKHRQRLMRLTGKAKKPSAKAAA
ncbi:MAG: iron ABC transporter permease [Clostridia bacterium]|nr:iron ABC transporter permease [Clostridia bacterium]